MFVEDVSAAATATFKKLQKDDTLVSRQRQAIANLRTCYKDYIKANVPLASRQRENIDIERDAASSNNFYSARVADMTTFPEDMGGFVYDRMQLCRTRQHGKPGKKLEQGPVEVNLWAGRSRGRTKLPEWRFLGRVATSASARAGDTEWT